MEKKHKKHLSEKDTLIRVLTPLVQILLVSELPDRLRTNTVNPFRDSFSKRQKQRFLTKSEKPNLLLDQQEAYGVK